MKKFAIVMALLLSFSLSAGAQDIFKAILSDSRKVVNDPGSNAVLKRIAQFKVSDLGYIRDKAFEKSENVPVKFLDDQAYYMNQFVNSFIKDVLVNTSLSKAEKKKRIILFMDASCSNPLYKDTDTDLVNAYVNDSKNQFTPFCLDTDWPKAFAAVQSKLKSK